jgi:hypothetical protein
VTVAVSVVVATSGLRVRGEDGDVHIALDHGARPQIQAGARRRVASDLRKPGGVGLLA